MSMPASRADRSRWGGTRLRDRRDHSAHPMRPRANHQGPGSLHSDIGHRVSLRIAEHDGLLLVIDHTRPNAKGVVRLAKGCRRAATLEHKRTAPTPTALSV